MITDESKWKKVKEVGDYTIQKQFIKPHDRYVYAVFGLKCVRKTVYSDPDDTHYVFSEHVGYWTLEECEKWIEHQNIKEGSDE